MRINKDKDLFPFLCIKCARHMWDTMNGNHICEYCKNEIIKSDIDTYTLSYAGKINRINSNRYLNGK